MCPWTAASPHLAVSELLRRPGQGKGCEKNNAGENDCMTRPWRDTRFLSRWDLPASCRSQKAFAGRTGGALGFTGRNARFGRRAVWPTSAQCPGLVRAAAFVVSPAYRRLSCPARSATCLSSSTLGPVPTNIQREIRHQFPGWGGNRRLSRAKRLFCFSSRWPRLFHRSISRPLSPGSRMRPEPPWSCPTAYYKRSARSGARRTLYRLT